jgi:hypothetical protein
MMAEGPKHVVLMYSIFVQKVVLMGVNAIENTVQRDATIQYSAKGDLLESLICPHDTLGYKIIYC